MSKPKPIHITRYYNYSGYEGDGEMIVDSAGDYVLYSDYEELYKTSVELASAVKQLGQQLGIVTADGKLAVITTAQPKPWRTLSDVQWMNIVNHPDVVRWDVDKVDAVNLVFKLIEAKLREINEHR